DVDAGFSVARQDTGTAIEEYGAEFLGYFTDRLSLFGRYSRVEAGGEAIEQGQLTADWRISEDGRVGVELRSIGERRNTGDVDALLAAVSYRHRLGSSLELYGVGQYTLDDDSGAYDSNDLLTLGARYQFGDRSTVGAEASGGSRGHGGKVDAEYRLTQEHTVYGGYSYSTDSTAREPLFSPDLQTGATLGQRWRVRHQTSVFTERQFQKEPRNDSSRIAPTFGMDFYPAVRWKAGFTLMDGELDALTGRIDRR